MPCPPRPFRPVAALVLGVGAPLAALALGHVGSPPQAAAQRFVRGPLPSAQEVYGRGVHAYFAGRSGEAEDAFNAAINAGFQDARAYYFRGLNRLKQGRQYEAEQDLFLGGSLEARNPGVGHAVSRDLTRVQGTHRTLLERYRRQARTQAIEQAAQLGQARYEQAEVRAPQVQRRPAQVPLGQLAQPALGVPSPPAVPQSGVAPQAAESRPAVRPEIPPILPAAESSVPTAGATSAGRAPGGEVVESDASADADPFGRELEADSMTLPAGAEPAAETGVGAAGAAKTDATVPSAADDDPFGEAFGEGQPAADASSPATDATPPATDATEPAAAEDPFGGPLGDDVAAPEGDAMGTDEPLPLPAEDAAEEPAEDADAMSPTEDADDPFGGAPAATPEDADAMSPTEDADASDADDPFAGEAAPRGATLRPEDEPAADAAPVDAPSSPAAPRRRGMLGVLGRVVGRAVPVPVPSLENLRGWNAVPSLPLPAPGTGPAPAPGAEAPAPESDAFELGPADRSPPTAPQEAPFGAVGPAEQRADGTPSGEPAESSEEADPFGDSVPADAPQEAPVEEPRPEAPAAEDPFADDPFGGDPFGGTAPPSSEESAPASDEPPADESPSGEAGGEAGTGGEEAEEDPFGGF